MDDMSSKGVDKSSSGPSRPVDNHADITLTVGFCNQLEEYIRNEVKLQVDNHVRSLDEKCEALLAKVPVLESHTSDILTLRGSLEKDRVKDSRVRLLELRMAEITTLQEELQREKEKRKENQGHFSDLVETLMEEIVQLSAKNAVLEERLGEIEKGNSSVRQQVSGVPQEQAPAGNSSRMRTPSPTLIIPAQTVKDPTDAEQTSVHQKAPVPGSNLPIACLCGMEFASDTNIAVHIGQQALTSDSSLDLDGMPVLFPAIPGPTESDSAEQAVQSHNSYIGISGSTSAPSCSTDTIKHHGKDPSSQLHCLCGMKHRNNVALYDHIRFYTGKKLLPCKTCGKRFVYAKQLKLHLKNVHRSTFKLGSSNWQNFHGANGRRGGCKGKRTGKPRTEEFIQVKIEVPESVQTRQDLENRDGSQTDVFLPGGTEEKLFCLCNQVSYGSMVRCDNKKCPKEWFHFECVGIFSDPKGKWYCPQCHQNIPGPSTSANPGP